MPKKKKKKRTNKSGKIRTGIKGHVRRGSELIPPFVDKLGGMSHVSWMNDRLPEMIWAVAILKSLGRDKGLDQFRRIINFVQGHERNRELSDLTISGLSNLEKALREEVLAFIVEPTPVREALSTLLLFETLPARESWVKVLTSDEPDVKLLMSAVGAALWHQSESATDCRWLRLMLGIVTGIIINPPNIDELIRYPMEGDQRKVRPGIRAMEMSLDMALNHNKIANSTWPKDFWDEGWRNTPCLGLTQEVKDCKTSPSLTRTRLNEINQALKIHWNETHSITSIDARHDAVFGMAFYSLKLLEELLGIGIGNTIIGRLGLRTILEVRINLRYLILKNEETLWKNWRSYGAGQAKLLALKFDEGLESPKYMDLESIESIAGEDIWEELLTVNLASWSGKDLRKMSEIAEVKVQYDQYYSWTSGYAHGMWGAIRETCFRTCGNPLHRLHRFPEQNTLIDAVDDGGHLVDCILEDLHQVYPAFLERFLVSPLNIKPENFLI